jgi:hypothetical protein
MLLWFFATSVTAVSFVFHDPRIDYRVVMLGSIIPDVVDVGFGGARVGHSLSFAAVVLLIVVVATTNRSGERRRWLALPIGMFFHLVFDGAWVNTKSFWWPFSGSWGDGRLPSVERGFWSAGMEVAGAVILAWDWYRFGLNDPGRRTEFLRTGRLDASVVT